MQRGSGRLNKEVEICGGTERALTTPYVSTYLCGRTLLVAAQISTNAHRVWICQGGLSQGATKAVPARWAAELKNLAFHVLKIL